MINALWNRSAWIRVGTLSIIVSLIGYSVIILSWLVGGLSLLPLLAFDLLSGTFSGLFIIGFTLVFYEVCRVFLTHQSLLLESESLTEEDGNEMVPDDAPPTPDGYDIPRLPDRSGHPIQGLMSYLPMLPLLWVVILLQQLLTAIRPFPPSPTGLAGIGSFIGVFTIMILSHELVHAGVVKLFGHSVSVGHRLPSVVFVVIQGAMIRRWQRIAILGAPLVVVTAGFIIGGFLAEGWIASVLINGALFNILVSSIDVYQVVESLKQPSQTLYFYPETGAMVRYEPDEAYPSLLTQIERQLETIIGPRPDT